MPAVDTPAPFADEELRLLFQSLADCRAVALAVSGGADSLALMLLVRRWSDLLARPPAVTVLTVDHRLRTGSADEAEMVASVAVGLGFRHQTLRWEGAKPETGIEAAAREARYALLADAARKQGIGDIVTAHHAEDQAETVLMRIGHGSGLAGLRGMRAHRLLAGDVELHRPLLSVPKERLEAVARAAGLVPVDDPSNKDARFLRARLRMARRALETAGIGFEGIALSAQRLARANEAIEYYVERLLDEAAVTDSFATVRLQLPAYRNAPIEVRLRALGRILAAVGARDWPPVKGKRLEALDASLVSEAPVKRTLLGAVLASDGRSAIAYRLSGRSPLPSIVVRPGDTGLWDRRFAFAIPGGPGGRFELGPLGADWRALGPAPAGVPQAALAALPALRRRGVLMEPSDTLDRWPATAAFANVVRIGRTSGPARHPA